MGNDIVQTLVPALGSLLIALLSWLAVWLAKMIQSKTQNSYLRGALIRLDDAIFTAVKGVTQTYVDAIKAASEDGTLTDNEKALAKAAAVSDARLLLGPKGLAALVKVLGINESLINDFLGSKVEAAVADLKTGPSPAPSPQ